MQTLVAKLDRKYPFTAKRNVVGFSDDKDISSSVTQLLLSTVPDPSHIHLVEANNLRAPVKLDKIFEYEPKVKGSRYDKNNPSVSGCASEKRPCICAEVQRSLGCSTWERILDV